MRNYRLSRPPHLLQRSTVHLDNVALVPASMLPLKGKWRAIANSLSYGETLIVLPYQAKQRHVARSVASRLRERGKHVTVMDSGHPLSAA